MMSYGNEPGGKNQTRFLGDFVNYWKNKDAAPAVHQRAPAGRALPENDFHVHARAAHPALGRGPEERHQRQAAPDRLRFPGDRRQVSTSPSVSHEIGQWCVYPNLEEIDEIHRRPQGQEFRDLPRYARSAPAWARWRPISWRPRASSRRSATRPTSRPPCARPASAGFELLDLHDFPGQGTALVGVLDPFWEEKGYIIARGVPPVLRPDRAARPPGQDGLPRVARILRGRHRGRAFRPGALDRSARPNGRSRAPADSRPAGDAPGPGRSRCGNAIDLGTIEPSAVGITAPAR